jgi:hypothetical protein
MTFAVLGFVATTRAISYSGACQDWPSDGQGTGKQIARPAVTVDDQVRRNMLAAFSDSRPF